MNINKWVGVLKAKGEKKEKIVKVMSIDDEPENSDWLHKEGEKDENADPKPGRSNRPANNPGTKSSGSIAKGD